MDGGICADNLPWDGELYACPGDEGYIPGESQDPIYYYEFAPMVEARLSVPNNYGMGQDETAPAFPDGVQVGWSSPVLHAFGDGDVAFPPAPPGALEDNGEPAGASVEWDIHDRLCTYAPGCRFNYKQPAC